MWWMTLGKGLLKRPWIIALIVMTLATSVQWVKITSLRGDVVQLQSEIVSIKTDFKTCKSNEVTLNDVIDQCKGETGEFKDNIALLEDQLDIEKARVVVWRDKYANKICFEPKDEVSVKKDEVRILNDEKNAEAINRINNLFKP
jgi:hypothetical protein